MSKRLVVAVGLGIVVGIAGVLVAQQTYPNVENAGVILENDRVVVQRLVFEPGEWVGMHSHAGNQLVVILDDSTTVYRDGDGEREETREAGEVFWIEAVEHDHKAGSEGEAILITLK